MMGNRLNELIQKVKAERLAARRYVAMLLVLAMLTSISVSWRLHQVGTALTTDDEYYCGYEEHVHDDSCYTEELVCGYEEGEPIQIDSAFGVDAEEPAEEPAESETPAESEEPEEPKVEVHHHTEDCYKEVTELTCDEKEHTHGEECYDTETGELLCTWDEHTHDESCYTTIEELICGYEEGEEIPMEDDASDAETETYAEEQNAAAVVLDDPESLVVTEPEVHHHTEACYEKVLTCTIPEHTHTLECLANWGADVEDRDDWDQYGQGLSDYWGNDLVQVAIEQLGYQESEKNFTVDEALGEAIDVHHYTRYGQWYGNPYAEWDVIFVAFCQHYAGIPKDIIPQRASLFALRTDLEKAHPEYLTAGGAKANWGQIVTYYNSDGDETIGIVEAVGENTDELTVISGAVNGEVAEVTINRADITNTILVKQAWADYTGYDLDDDQEPDTTDPADGEEPSDEQPDDDITVLPGEDEVASDDADAAVIDTRWATYADGTQTDTIDDNDPVFDTTDAIDLTDYITNSVVKKSDGKGGWQDIMGGETLGEGSQIHLDVDFEMLKDAFKKEDGTYQTKAYVQLPVGLAKTLANVPIKLSDGTVVGTMYVNKDGLAVIVFQDQIEGKFDIKEDFKGSFYIEGNASLKSTDESEQIKFPGSETSFTLKRESDIDGSKSASNGVSFDEKGPYVLYTVTVNSTKGTANQKISINDQMITDQLDGEYDIDSFKLTKNGTKISDGTLTVDNNALPKNFAYTGIPALGENESYTLTYKYRLKKTAGGTYNWKGVLQNRVSLDYGKEGSHTPVIKECYKSYDSLIEKKATYGTDEQKKGLLRWTIDVPNPNGTSMEGFTIEDVLGKNGAKIMKDILGDGVYVKIESGENKDNCNTLVDTIKSLDENGNFSYKFGADATAKYYRFTYYTSFATDGTSVTNTATIKRNDTELDHKDSSSGEVTTPGKWQIVKSRNSEMAYEGQYGKLNWNLTVKTSQSMSENSFEITDTFRAPKVDNNTVADTDLHYALLGELDQALKNGMTLFYTKLDGGVYTSGTLSWAQLKAYTEGNSKIQVTYSYYADEAGTQEITDTPETSPNTHVKSFKIKVKWNADQMVTQININNYKTYVDVTKLEAGKDWLIPNELSVDRLTDSKFCSYPYRRNNSNFYKLVDDNPWYFDTDNSAVINYGNSIWFKLWIENPESDEIEITDLLQEGLELPVENDTVKWNEWLYVGFSKSKESGVNTSNGFELFEGCDKTGFNSADNKRYVTVTSTKKEDGTQEVKFKLTNLNKLNAAHRSIAIFYRVQLTDSYWGNIKNTGSKDYGNTARWGTEKEASATATIKRADNTTYTYKSIVDSKQDHVDYKVVINSEAKNLLNIGGKLELEDVLTIPSCLSAEIDGSSVKLYEDDNCSQETADTWSFTADANPELDGTNKIYRIKIQVPDGKKYVLRYTYKFTQVESTSQENLTISNRVSMFGYGEGPKQTVISKVYAGGSVTVPDNDTLILRKVEQGREYNTLAGAVFKLEKYNAESGSWETVNEQCTTNDRGEVTFEIKGTNGNQKVEYNTLYRLVETTPPTGYALDQTPHYFLMLPDGETDTAAAYAKATGNKFQLPAGSSMFYMQHGEAQVLKITNAQKKFQIEKVWKDADGLIEGGNHAEVKINLYKYKPDEGVENKTFVKTITLSDTNGWSYMYPGTEDDAPVEDGYQYYVEEKTIPNGYRVLYTKDDGTYGQGGIVSGDDVTITNQKKTDYLSVEKKWFDEDGNDVTASLTEDYPESITVKLYKVGSNDEPLTATLNVANNWKCKFTNLDPEANYHIKEELPDGFEGSFRIEYANSETGEEPYPNGVCPGTLVIIRNYKKGQDTSYELPATGSTGTTPYTAGGALIMGAALVCGYLKKRRRGKGAE